MLVRHKLTAARIVGAAFASATFLIVAPAHAQALSSPATYAVQMPVPPVGQAYGSRYDGGWRGTWQDRRTYRGDWSGTYEADGAQTDSAAIGIWLNECRVRLTAAGQLGDQTRIADACSSWLAYFQAAGPNQPASLYTIPVMLVPVMTPNKDCVTQAEIVRPVHRHPVRRQPVLHDKRVRILPD